MARGRPERSGTRTERSLICASVNVFPQTVIASCSWTQSGGGVFKRFHVRKKGSKIREKTTRSCEGTLKFCVQGCIKFTLFPLPVPRPVNFCSFGRFRLNLWKLHVLQTVQTIKPARWRCWSSSGSGLWILLALSRGACKQRRSHDASESTPITHLLFDSWVTQADPDPGIPAGSRLGC